MLVAGVAQRTIRVAHDGVAVEIIDQTRLPFELRIARLASVGEVAEAIASMRVRGAPLIGVAAAYGVWLALREDASDAALEAACGRAARDAPHRREPRLGARRDARGARGRRARASAPPRALAKAAALADDDVATCRAIGEHGARLIGDVAAQRGGEPVNLLTHCNAGWLATVDWGTALAPVYVAFARGIPLHVWVSETRPRNQGASLTAWELAQQGVPHTVVADSAAGHLLQRGRVDLVLIGSDRTTATGDVCNKIGTYPKALAARDNGIPFYVALPHSTIDWSLTDGIAQIPIEERSADELRVVAGRAASGERAEVRVLPDASPARNFAFDVTPARLVTGLITERGVCKASAEGLLSLYPERRRVS